MSEDPSRDPDPSRDESADPDHGSDRRDPPRGDRNRRNRRDHRGDRTREPRNGNRRRGRSPPQRGGSSRGGSSFTSPDSRRTLQTLVGSMVGVGVLIGVTALVLGALGGPEIGVTPAAGVDFPEAEVVAEYERKVDRTVQSYAAVKVSEFAAVVLAPLLGWRLGERTENGQEVLLPVGMGAGIGATLLVVVAGLLGTLRIPTYVVPVQSRLLTFTFRVQVTQLLVNAALVGVLAAVAAVVAAYLGASERTARV